MTYNDMKFAEQKRTRKGEFIECETYKTIFYVPRSRILYQERVGTKIRYCSKKCYTKLGDKNPFWGKHHSKETKQKFIENPNRNRFQSIHNNTIGNNILLLCPNCHSAEHYKHKDGKYRPGKGRPYES